MGFFNKVGSFLKREAKDLGDAAEDVKKKLDDELTRREDELKMTLRQALDYHRLVCERNELQRQLDRERKTVTQLEKSNPGISKLPARDESGAFVLTKKDLPE